MSLRNFLSSTSFCLIATALSSNVAASVIFNNGGPDGFRGGWSDIDQGQNLADDFSLDIGGSSINGISWSGSYFSTNTPVAVDDFIFNFYAEDLPLLPFLSIEVGNSVTRIDSGIDQELFDLDIYNYSSTFEETLFSPGETYYLSIVNNTAGAVDDWLWEQSSSAGNAQVRFAPLEQWIEVNSEFSFALHSNPVPVPDTLALVALGLMGCGVARSRRARL